MPVNPKPDQKREHLIMRHIPVMMLAAVAMSAVVWPIVVAVMAMF